MDVTVETQCSRCGRKDEKRVSLADAQVMETADRERDAAQTELQKQFDSYLTDMKNLAPDFVLIRKVSGREEFYIDVLDNLCHAPDAKRNKRCKARVEILMKEIFLENPKPEAKPKKKSKVKDVNKSEGGTP